MCLEVCFCLALGLNFERMYNKIIGPNLQATEGLLVQKCKAVKWETTASMSMQILFAKSFLESKSEKLRLRLHSVATLMILSALSKLPLSILP